MKNYTEIIAKYMSGELSETDKTSFEKELKTNSDLNKEYELQLKIIEGVKRLGLKNQIASSFKTVKTQKIITKAFIGVAITIAVIGAVVLVKKTMHKNNNQILHELNEQGNTNWSEADKAIESQVFKLNPLRDTIIETKNGIVFSIPAKTFLNKQGQTPEGQIELEIKEAMTPLEIMKAGLSTTSNGKLLETGGMFYVNARVEEESLTIDKSNPINANVPVNNNKKDMMLFKGERKVDGSINWIDPKPMKKKLTTVDITKLNFYPEYFLDSLKAMGFNTKNKKLTDSIYYSFSNLCEINYDVRYSYDEATEPIRNDYAISIAARDTIKHVFNGEKLFELNCAVCHSRSTQKLTGPGLAGILNRAPKGDWLKKYILNNNEFIVKGDAYALKLIEENGGVDAMSEFDKILSGQDVDAIIKYITGQDTWVIDNNDGKEHCGEINPSRIHAIWDKKFNHTILATKEFEERLKVIFTTCDRRIINLYVNNLKKNLYEIDSVAASLLDGELKNKFLKFYERRDGGIKITNERSEKLQAYFEEKKNTYSKAINDALVKMYETETKQLTVANDRKIKQLVETFTRSSKTFTEELEINMDEAYRQLGKERPKAVPPDEYISGDVSQTGWNNVDRYVIESTINRTTLDYTDPESGKIAIIKYEPISITVNKFKDYDKVVCYMIPDKLSSFQLIKNTGNIFKENLNELLNYSIITIGFKGNDMYYNEITSAKAQAYMVDLKSIKSADLDKKLNTSFALNQQTDLMKDINYQLFEIKETTRVNKIQRREEITARLYPVIFPCSNPVAAPSKVEIQTEALDFNLR